MNTKLLGQLQDLHLPENEARVYVVLAGLGESGTGEIIKKTGLHRSVVYESLDRLIDKKLVWKFTKHNIAHFSPTDPALFVERAKSELDTARELIPTLHGLIKNRTPEITVYEGVESYRRFWLDSVRRLPKGSTDYVAGSIGKQWTEYMGQDLKKYYSIRYAKKIKWKMILFGKGEWEMGLKKQYPDLHEYRLVEKHVAKTGNFNIFEKESIVLHSIVEPMIIEVKNPSLVKVFQNLFDILWESGRPIR